jgi:hypothetical protein
MYLCIRNTLIHQLLKEQNSTFSTWLKFLPKRRFHRSWGLELTIQSEHLFCSFLSEQVVLRGNEQPFWNPGVITRTLIPICRPNVPIHFVLHRCIYIVYDQEQGTK